MRAGPLVTVVYPDLERPDHPLRTITGILTAPNTVSVPEVYGIGCHAHIVCREWIVQFAQARPLSNGEASWFWSALSAQRATVAAVECPNPCCTVPAVAMVDLVTVAVVGLVGESITTDLDVVEA